MDDSLTDQERRAISSLRRLAGRWPKSLMLASLDGELVVLRAEDRSGADAGLSEDSIVADGFRGIPNTGGAW